MVGDYLLTKHISGVITRKMEVFLWPSVIITANMSTTLIPDV